MANNKIIHQCTKCSKTYKTPASLKKHTDKCKEIVSLPTAQPPTVTSSTATSSTATLSTAPNTTSQPNTENSQNQENNYDVNMTFLEGNKVEVEVKKQPNEGDEKQDGEKVLKEILKPKISPSYQDEIDKLESLVKVIKTLPLR